MKMEKQNETYEVIEDNAGGLHLAIIDENINCIAFYSGFERDVGSLCAAIESIDELFDIQTDSAQREYDEYIDNSTIVADSDWVYQDEMGCAALIEFNCNSDENETNAIKTISYDSWLKQFNRLTENYIESLGTVVIEFSNNDISDIADSLQLDAFYSLSEIGEDLQDWKSYEASCNDRTDFMHNLAYIAVKNKGLVK